MRSCLRFFLLLVGLGLCSSAYPADGVKQAYFGDLHIHTMYSMDAFMRSVRTTPDDAYLYAKGEPIPHPDGSNIRLHGPPLDFLAVTDHAAFLGVHASFLQPESPNFDHPIKAYITEPFATEIEFQTKMLRLRALVRDEPEVASMAVIEDAWQRTIAAAQRHYQPGRFTTFIGYEFTSTTKARHLHRNVIFRSGEVPQRPFSVRDSPDPQKLWAWLDGLRVKGIEGLAIPHNMNQSDGLAFPESEPWGGGSVDAAYAEQRTRNEPVVELTQLKGTSETHPALSPNDEWANFQIVQYYRDKVNNADPISIYAGGYARDALLRGLRMQDQRGFNPYVFGFIGSSDSHLSGGSYVESSYFSKNANTPQLRGSSPGEGRSWQDVFTPREASHGPGGLAGIWAAENTREALYDAMRRKETFATSGPRIRVRMFAGTNFPDNAIDLTQPELFIPNLVLMGGTLSYSDDAPPSFLIEAQRDPASAWLERAQIVKGWIEDGEMRERVFDVACADGRKPDADHRCPPIGPTVDLQNCSVDQSKGDVALRAVWTDPEFKASNRAFYYLRVLEIPTCRWSTWDAVRLGIEPNPDLQSTQQDRAWTSPIWYDPGKG